MTIRVAARNLTVGLLSPLLAVVCLLAGIMFISPAAAAQGPVIERIDFVGNRRIPRDTLRGRIFTREGDPYNEDAIRRDFMALWNTQFFEDIRLEVEDSTSRPNAKIIVFYVRERPVIRRIEYKGVKSVQVSDILERFKERKVGLSVESQFDPARIRRAEVVLRDLLAEHGRQFATIDVTYERIPATNAVTLTYNVNEGPKVKVGQITIEGNTIFSDRRIIRSMRHSRPIAIPLLLFDITIASKTFDRNQLSEDLEIGVRSLYQDHGYFQVLVEDPKIDTIDINRGGIPGPWPLVGSRHGKRTNITIPLVEGDQFRMAKLFFRSNDPTIPLRFKPELLATIFPLKEGDIFAVDKIRKAIDDYKKLYGEFGFIDFTSSPTTDIHSNEKTIDLTWEFEEGKQFFVRRIEFSGNTTTRDKVIRREVLIDEGDVFNNRYWELSLLRLNQLDYFDPLKPETSVDVKRNLKDGTVDLLLKVKEKGKQSIGLTGGISGLAGSFIGFSYQTNNFLGLGETLTFSAELGDRQRNVLFGFTEPYLFDRPISAGFTVFSSRYSFDQARETSLAIGQQIQLDPNIAQNYDQSQQGFSVFASYPLRRFSFTRVGLTYSLTSINVTAFSEASRVLFEALQFRSLAGPSSVRGIRSSKIVPTINYNTVDHPINPTRGKSLFLSSSFEGGPLQGNVNVFTQVMEAKYFRPINHRRNVLGFRLLTAFASGHGGLVLPPYNRFYLGGEDSVRGFDIRTVSPVAFVPVEGSVPIVYLDPTELDPQGNPTAKLVNVNVLDYSIAFPGGDVQAVANAEYRIPIAGPVSMSFFLDFGLTGALRRSQLQVSTAALEKINKDFPGFAVNPVLDLAAGTNFKPRTSSGVEFVVQLPVVNAPFRVYWAYNLTRLATQFREPQGAFPTCAEIEKVTPLPPLVCEAQVQPQLNQFIKDNARRINFFEPLRTFRFTVSRTF